MARIHGILILTGIAGGTVLWFAAVGEAPAAPPLLDAAPVTDHEQRPPRADEAHGRAAAPMEPEASRSPKQSSAEDAPAQPIAPAADLDAPVVLAVHRLEDRLPLAKFTWRFHTGGSGVQKGEGQDGASALAITRGARGRLLVESPGRQPHVQELTAPQAGEPVARLDVYLPEVARLVGVTLELRDLEEMPLLRARLDCWMLDGQSSGQETQHDPEAPPLWRRIGEDPTGILRLPDLAPGEYALRAQPVDAEGTPLAWLPQRFRFRFHGNEAVPLRAVFARGATLRLVCREQHEPTAQFDVTTLPSQGGTAIPTLWQSRDGDGRPSAGEDVVLLPGEAWTLLALPPGAYRIELRRGASVLQFAPGPTQDGTTTYEVTMPR